MNDIHKSEAKDLPPPNDITLDENGVFYLKLGIPTNSDYYMYHNDIFMEIGPGRLIKDTATDDIYMAITINEDRDSVTWGKIEIVIQ